MRASFYNRYDSINDASTQPISVNFVGPLLLHADPVNPLHVATKRFVDGIFTGGLSADDITSEILSVDLMPEFTGDATASQGSNVFTLKPSGVAPGNYKKVTVDAKGLITGATQLAPEDIPNLTWNKITTGKPVSILGYGINDAIRSTGDSLVGTIRVQAAVTQDLHAATRQYVELKQQEVFAGEPTGTIVEKSVNSAPIGFLRCNGGEIDKNTYPALYSVIGDRFGTTYEPGCGQPYTMGSQIINDEPDITAWTPGINLPVTVSRTTLTVTKNAVYVLGNYIPSNGSSATIYKGTINAEGTITDWVVAGSMPYASYWGASCVIKDRLYTFGGTINGTANSYNLVRSCKINVDGTLDSTWRTETGLPGNMYALTCVVLKNRIHVLCSAGGYTATYNSLVQSDGALSNWATGPAFTTAPNGFAAHAVIKNYLYILGGAGSLTKIQRATINVDGTLGAWSDAGTLPYGFSQATFAVTKTRIYLIGGFDGSAYVSRVMHAPINTDGTIGTWTSLNSLPSIQANNMAFFTKNKLYLIGNSPNGGTSALATTYYASMSSEGGFNDYMPFYDGTYASLGTSYNPETMPGSGKPWQQQYQFNTVQTADITDWVSGPNLPIALSQSQAIVTKNRVYLLSGYNGPATTSTICTAPINVDGTLGAWTTSTSLPAAILSAQAIVTKDRVHVIGGHDGSSARSTVYTASINADGTLGTWTTGTSLPTGLFKSQAIVTKNRVYLLGGHNGSSHVATVYTASINADGTLGTWTTGTSLPVAFGDSQAVVTKNRVYLLGGIAASRMDAVYTAPINEDGTLGTWTTGPSLPVVLGASQAIVTKNQVYLLGGDTGSTQNSVYTAPINEDGTLGAWTTGTSLPAGVSYAQAVVTNNKIHLLGGGSGSLTYIASFSGGSNDYSTQYNTSYSLIIEPTKFRLPDLSKYESEEINYFIRY